MKYFVVTILSICTFFITLIFCLVTILYVGIFTQDFINPDDWSLIGELGAIVFSAFATVFIFRKAVKFVEDRTKVQPANVNCQKCGENVLPSDSKCPMCGEVLDTTAAAER